MDSREYWNNRYKKGGNSGSGSQGKLLTFKAKVINDFIKKNKIQSVCEIGSGDGELASRIKSKFYRGFDISDEALLIASKRNPTIDFYGLSGLMGVDELALSIDVIFHCITDQERINHLTDLDQTAEKYIILYAWNHDIQPGENWAQHYRPCNFINLIEKYFPNWELIQKIEQKYPVFQFGTTEGSYSDFYIFFHKKRIK